MVTPTQALDVLFIFFMFGKIFLFFFLSIMTVLSLQEILQEKDNLNQRYLRKRALYLAHMAHHLSQSKIIGSVKFAYMNSNHLKPVLLLRPQGKREMGGLLERHYKPPAGTGRRRSLYISHP